jgi:TolB-like protein
MGSFFGELKRRNVVRVGAAYIIVGWVVVQIAQVLFEAFGTPDWVIKTVIVLIAIGFPFVLLFAWAFEITPDGVKKTRDVDLSSSITPSTGKRLNLVIIASLVIALGYFIWERQAPDNVSMPAEETTTAISEPVPVPAETVAERPRSIAVLPFLNMSSDDEQEWFADGLTEEILNSLAKTPDLLVAARTSSFGYKGSTDPITEIASVLGVDHVLEGSVRRSGDRLRITAQLIRATDGFHLWSETFDRTPDDIITIQEEIAIQIARALETAMDPAALAEMMSAGTSSVPAFDAYLTGLGIWREAIATGDVYRMLDARDEFENAIELDPEFSKAYFRLYWFWSSQMLSAQIFYGLTDLSHEEIKKRRDEALDNAIDFESDPVTARYLSAFRAWGKLDIRRAHRLIVEYRKQRPNDWDAFGFEIGIMSELALFKEIPAIVEDILERDVLNADNSETLLQGLRTVEDAELMRRLARESVERFGDDSALVLYQAHRQLLWASDIDGASGILPRIQNSDLPVDNRQLAELRQLCAEGRTTDADRLYAKMMEQYPDEVGLKWLATKVIGHDEAAEQQFMAFDEQNDFETLASYLNYPQFDPKPFPNFMKALAGQEMEDRVVLQLPYRCNRS